MVAIVPNRTEIQGKIISLKADKKRKDFHSMKLLITSITDAKDELSLADFDRNTTITVLIAKKVMKEHKLKKGIMLSCLVRKAGQDEYFIIPDSIHSSS